MSIAVEVHYVLQSMNWTKMLVLLSSVLSTIDEVVVLYVNIIFAFLALYYRQYTTEYKLDTYVKVARLYLEDDDPVNAEAFINRASHLQADTKDEKLQIYYKVS